jgi:hypothetical protein
MFDKFVHFLKGAVVEEKLDTFADGEFAFAMLALAALGSAAFFSRGVATAEFFEAIHRIEGVL